MFRIHNFEEMKLTLELLSAMEPKRIQFPIEIYRTEKRVSVFQYGLDLEVYTYVDGKRAVVLEAGEGTSDRRASCAKDEAKYERTIGSTTRSKTCHDCGAVEGAIHNFGCDMEACPYCGGQLITCSCMYEHLGYEYDTSDPYCGLGEDVYSNGISHEEEEKFLSILEAKGRIPYIVYPVICGKCGKLWPDLFNIPDEEWTRYIEPRMRHEVICQECYDRIKEDIDVHDMQPVA